MAGLLPRPHHLDLDRRRSSCSTARRSAASGGARGRRRTRPCCSAARCSTRQIGTHSRRALRRAPHESHPRWTVGSLRNPKPTRPTSRTHSSPCHTTIRTDSLRSLRRHPRFSRRALLPRPLERRTHRETYCPLPPFLPRPLSRLDPVVALVSPRRRTSPRSRCCCSASRPRARGSRTRGSGACRGCCARSISRRAALWRCCCWFRSPTPVQWEWGRCVCHGGSVQPV
jgi:hypothetical protein